MNSAKSSRLHYVQQGPIAGRAARECAQSREVYGYKPESKELHMSCCGHDSPSGRESWTWRPAGPAASYSADPGGGAGIQRLSQEYSQCWQPLGGHSGSDVSLKYSTCTYVRMCQMVPVKTLRTVLGCCKTQILEMCTHISTCVHITYKCTHLHNT